MPGDDSIRFSWQAINREATANNDSCIFLKRRIYREQNCFYWYGSLLAVLVLAFLENFSLDFFGWCNFVQFSYGWPSDKLWKLWNIYESMPSNKHWSTNCRFCRSIESIQLLWVYYWRASQYIWPWLKIGCSTTNLRVKWQICMKSLHEVWLSVERAGEYRSAWNLMTKSKMDHASIWDLWLWVPRIVIHHPK